MRQQDLLGRAIDEPNALTDTEWDELVDGPTACDLWNIEGRMTGLGAVGSLLIMGVGALFSITPLLAIGAGLAVGFAGWWLYTRARYGLRLRRARREHQPTTWPGA